MVSAQRKPNKVVGGIGTGGSAGPVAKHERRGPVDDTAEGKEMARTGLKACNEKSPGDPLPTVSFIIV